MEHLRKYRAAIDGKLRGNKSGERVPALAYTRRVIFAIVALLVATLWG